MSNNFRDFECFLEKHVVVMLKDGRSYYGIFKSFDQYNSITLNYAIERIFDGEEYGEKFLGLFVIRGDVVMLVGISKCDFKKYKKVDYEIIKKRVTVIEE
ncbi:U6 snRNA-associated Sm-like protein LSm1 [Nosema bombycis CQ1]|uniref:U6 snRNA-associated Sm-like protein LSm1 n=1 Tax=Nosema bombycis (strain CQ1 / CVCC 102059) TaxID=578461 RepID=R0MIG3_NOSB1|nr:U6 snRNA-associated Sm-like protein LSm1 [Nosema bombycis CQ1]|eukprot:EOB13935.1 U6 snRNA-associated Sm-like protein LSm1 [Nosema bombycis CQ1]